MNLEKVMDITIADRTATQLQNEIKIKELQERVRFLEEELKKHKSEIEVISDPMAELHTVTISVNGVTKIVDMTDITVDSYLATSDPVQSIVSDLIYTLTIPYIDMVKAELTPKISRIVKNRIGLVNRRGLL
jgi:hypothetical protein